MPDMTHSPALDTPCLSARDRALVLAAQAIRFLLQDAERTAENSFHPSFIEVGDGRREEIPWRDGWRLDDPEGFEIWRRARHALAAIETLLGKGATDA